MSATINCDVATTAIAIPHAIAKPNRSSPPIVDAEDGDHERRGERRRSRRVTPRDSSAKQPHAMVAPPDHLREVNVQHFALAARPPFALRPQRSQRRRNLHADERVRLVDRLPACKHQLPGQVDVLGGHPRVVSTDGQHAVAAEQPQYACDDADAPSQRLGAANEADYRGRLQHLHARRIRRPRLVTCGRAGDGRHHRRAAHARDEQLERLGMQVRVGVDRGTSSCRARRKPSLSRSALPRLTGSRSTRQRGSPPAAASAAPRCRRSSRRRGPAPRVPGSRRPAPPLTLIAMTLSSL